MYWSSPANPAMNALASVRPCSDNAASCSAAIQPSVRSFEGRDVVVAQPQVHRLVEVIRRFVGGESQLVGPHLDQLTASPQLGQRQRRIDPGDDDQMQLRRLVLEDEGHSLVHLGRLDDVVVVERQHEIVGQRLDLVEQRREGGIGRCGGRGEQRQRGLAEFGHGRAHRRHQVGPEQRRIVVPVVERQPRDGRAARARPAPAKC